MGPSFLNINNEQTVLSCLNSPTDGGEAMQPVYITHYDNRPQGRRSGISSGGGDACDKNTAFCMLLLKISQQEL